MNNVFLNSKRTLTNMTAISLLIGMTSIHAPVALADTPLYKEPYRNQLQYSPAANWMNDPNGLVYHNGQYHLFYQYNPLGDRWGNMSWGHAVSDDLTHWQELPIALAAQYDSEGNVTESFYSGSAVVDYRNTSGLGTQDNPAMIAIYTHVYHTSTISEDGRAIEPGTQAQSIAYSLDNGLTWAQYHGNPVILMPPNEYIDQFRSFRDPKVFWYKPEQKWVMATVLPKKQKVLLYSSKNLTNWSYMSEFGPSNGLGGIWECPDLFEMPVQGSQQTKWILTVNMNPGASAGGSGVQYFVGDFDGQKFIPDNNTLYTNDANDDAELIPGGDFEFSDYYTNHGWQATGDFVTATPDSPLNDSNIKNYHGQHILHTFLYQKGDGATGTLTSPPFVINKNYISFQIAGGAHPHQDSSSLSTESIPGETTINLIVNGKIIASDTGHNNGLFNWRNWQVAALKGQTAQIQIIDSYTSDWGHLLIDHIVQSDQRKQVANWADFGSDFYAAVTWNHTPSNQKIWIGWLNDWRYGESIPTSPWRSSQTFARQLALRNINNKLMLTQQPIKNLTDLRNQPLFKQFHTSLQPGQSLIDSSLRAKVYEIKAVFVPGTGTQDITFKLRTGENGQQTILSYNFDKQHLSLDRRNSGTDNFSDRFPDVHTAPLVLTENKLFLRILVDTASVTVFANQGEVVMTEQIFPDGDSQGLDVSVTGDAVEVSSFILWPLQSIWQN